MSKSHLAGSLQRALPYLRLGFFILIGLILWFSSGANDADFHLAMGFWFTAAGCDFLFSVVPAQYRLVRLGLRVLSGLCGIIFVAIVVLDLSGTSIIEQWQRQTPQK
jgi:hypothetical protein